MCAHAAVAAAPQTGGDAERAQQAVEGVAGFGQQLRVVAAGGKPFNAEKQCCCKGWDTYALTRCRQSGRNSSWK